MRSFLSYMRLALQEYSVYRLNFFFWRTRMFVRLLISLFVWKAVFAGQGMVGAYSGSTMVAYLLLVHVVGALVQSSRVDMVGDQINSGELSNFLVKPVSFFSEVIGREVADKLVNLLFVPFEIIFALLLTGTSCAVSLHLSAAGIVLLVMSMLLYFAITLCISLSGFWTTEIWALRFFFIVLTDFSAGTLIPLDLYPEWLQRILLSSPFASLIFAPVQVLLGRESTLTGWMLRGVLWLCVFLLLTTYLWKKGLRVYEAQGR